MDPQPGYGAEGSNPSPRCFSLRGRRRAGVNNAPPVPFAGYQSAPLLQHPHVPDSPRHQHFGRSIVKIEAAVDLDAMIHEVRNSGGIMLPDEVLVTRRIRDMGLLK